MDLLWQREELDEKFSPTFERADAPDLPAK